MDRLGDPCDAFRETFLARAGNADEALRRLDEVLFPVMLEIGALAKPCQEPPLRRDLRAVIVDLEYAAGRLAEMGEGASGVPAELGLVTTAVACGQIVQQVAERLRQTLSRSWKRRKGEPSRE